jgi:hypothetical protein
VTRDEQRVELHLQERNGHFWCLTHDTWWKLCPCPGTMSTTVTVTQEMLDAEKPRQGAYLEFLEKQLAP